MSVSSRLQTVYGKSEHVVFDDNSRIVFFSDIHRADGSKADDFIQNRSIYLHALDYYYNNGFTYIEVGDGDELWENDHFSTLLDTNLEVYLKIRDFHSRGRFYMLLGNHDVFKRRKSFVKRNLYQYYNPDTDRFEPLFDNIKIHEGLVLKYNGTDFTVFVVHGHHGDLLNDRLWPITRFLVRYIWRHMQFLGIRDPFSPARNQARAINVERNIINWVRESNQMSIMGHTHKIAFAKPGEAPYFNCGCCTRKGYITGIEIQKGQIMLVRWNKVKEANNRIKLTREIIAGPEKIRSYAASKF